MLLSISKSLSFNCNIDNPIINQSINIQSNFLRTIELIYTSSMPITNFNNFKKLSTSPASPTSIISENNLKTTFHIPAIIPIPEDIGPNHINLTLLHSDLNSNVTSVPSSSSGKCHIVLTQPAST